MVQLILYGNDIARNSLQEALNNIHNAAKIRGLGINEKKIH